MTDFLFTSADVFLGLLFVDGVVGRVGLLAGTVWSDSFVCFGEVIMDGTEGDEDVVSDVTEI